LFGADAWADPKLYKEASGKADILFAGPQTPDNKDFDAKMLAKTGSSQVGVCVPEAYDAMNLIAKTIATSGTNPDSFASTLRSMVYDGISGKISFDQNGDLASASYVVKRIANGIATQVSN
jgi:branched-chain amino acid transport system substrate-binding protein